MEMIVKFKTHAGNFIVAPRELVDHTPQLSAMAKYILIYLLGRPPHWKPSIKEIANHLPDSFYAIKTGVRELKTAGYISIHRLRDSDTGQMRGWEWEVFPSPQQKMGNPPQVENPHTVKMPTIQEVSENPHSENPTKLHSPKVDSELSANSPEKGEDLAESSPKVDTPTFGDTDFRSDDFVSNKDLSKKKAAARATAEVARHSAPHKLHNEVHTSHSEHVSNLLPPPPFSPSSTRRTPDFKTPPPKVDKRFPKGTLLKAVNRRRESQGLPVLYPQTEFDQRLILLDQQKQALLQKDS